MLAGDAPATDGAGGRAGRGAAVWGGKDAEEYLAFYRASFEGEGI